jgi:glycosyltransferase involved in cell wall biosynthesis
MHFVPYFPPERVGGVGEFVAALHDGLIRRGHDSQVVTAGAASHGSVHRIARTRLGWFLATARWIGRAADCDVVHCQGGEALPLLLGLRLRTRRRPRILVTFHVSNAAMARAAGPYRIDGRRFAASPGERLRERGMGFLHTAVDVLALRLADAINTVARSTARELLGRRLGDEARVIYNPLPRAAVSGEPAAPVDLFYAGLASHRKRVAVLPFVLRRIRRSRPGVRLRLAGFDLEEEAWLRDLFAEQGCLDAVECIGRRPAGKLAAHYRAARVVVVPSACEGLPYVLIEALAQATPEVIGDGVGGTLVPVDDPGALATACLALLEDPERARALGEAGRALVAERFDPDRQIDAYLDYYRALSKEAS